VKPGRRWLWLLVVAAALCAGGVALARVQSGQGPSDPALVAVAKRGTLDIEILETGRVEPREKVELRSKLAGEVIAVHADRGDRVRKGDRLVSLDPTDFQREVAAALAELAKLQAAIDFARSTLARKRQGVADRIVPSAELDDAEHALGSHLAERRILEVRLSAARDRVRYTQILAPMDGVVIQREIEVGEVVVPGVQATFEGKPLLTVADLSTLRVTVDLNQIDVAKVRLGREARVTFDALPGKTITATITRIAPASTRLSGKDVEVFPVEAELVAADPEIRPGMTADVRIRLEEKKDVITLPIEAVLREGGQARVIRLLTDERGEERAETVDVTLGAQNDRELELSGGLNEGDRVLINPASARANELRM
jgi:HlyD family secretion protein/macrolide-specific efflux system membrane fusion protein